MECALEDADSQGRECYRQLGLSLVCVCVCVWGRGKGGAGEGGQSREVRYLLSEAGPGRTLNFAAYTERARRFDRMLRCCCHRSSINGPSPDSLCSSISPAYDYIGGWVSLQSGEGKIMLVATPLPHGYA